MKLLPVKFVWWRTVQPGEFFNIERDPNSMKGGGGARYIEIPNSLVADTLALLGREFGPDGLAPEMVISARTIGSPTVKGDLEFRRKAGGRLRIANQNRQATPESRHPAWRSDRGFPRAPDSVMSSSSEELRYPEGGLRVYIVKTVDDEYFAGFTQGEAPDWLPKGSPMRALYGKGAGGLITGNGIAMNDAVQAVLKSWANGRNALLYGPPGTGKTRILSQLFDLLSDASSHHSSSISLDPSQTAQPLQSSPYELPFPLPVKVAWATFHQSYGYEDFVLGLRPEMKDDGRPVLRPQLGLLLDSLYELTRKDRQYESVVIFIDEINRGNAARIFGELMTFLDFDYRDGTGSDSERRFRIPLNLGSLRREGDVTEEVSRLGGELVRLPVPLYFPHNVYIVGTMNSVDRAAVPIDSALARRFDRIEVRPDLQLLSEFWNITWDSLEETAAIVRLPESDEWSQLSVFETSLLLLDRLNAVIAGDLGTEFELGHGLMMSVRDDTDEGWAQLFSVWDEVVFPQLEDRFAGRPEHLLNLLKVTQPSHEGYAWKTRVLLGGGNLGRALQDVRLSSLPFEDARKSLQWLSL